MKEDQERLYQRDLLLTGAASVLAATADARYFEGLRDRVRKSAEAFSQE